MKKRLMVAALLLCVVFVLTGCACKHENAQVINQQEADCLNEGYTGDTMCPDCNKVIAQGKTIPVTAHGEAYLDSEKAATCTAEGYTGDRRCSDCHTVLTPGAAVPMLAHSPETVGVIVVSCTTDGYTGDSQCSMCKALLEKGESIPAEGHQPGERVNVQAASCVVEGYTGDILCTVCGETLEKGEALPLTEHTPGKLYNAIEPTCTSIGYTGTAGCTWCGMTVIYAEEIPRKEHSWGEMEGVVEANCTQEGYTGDRTCTVCHQTEKGQIIPRAPHAYADNVCTVCGWMTPGLYNGGELVFTWEQLVENGLIEIAVMDRNARAYEGYTNFDIIAEDMEGTLVVDESINMIGFVGDTFIYGYRTFGNCKGLKEVYLPCTLNFIGRFPFERSGVEKIHFFGEISLIMDGAFKKAEGLRHFDVPEGITSIGFDTFADCTSLESVTLPSTLKEIGYRGFYGCESLRQIDLPEGLESIDKGAFAASGLESVVLPSTLTYLGKEAFSSCSNLTTADASRTQLTKLEPRVFNSCNFTYAKLPATLVEADDGFGTAPIEILELPRGFNLLRYEPNLRHLKTIVWPLSFVDKGKVLVNAKPEKVYYEGSEMQWKTLLGDRYPEAEMIFNYDYSYPVE